MVAFSKPIVLHVGVGLAQLHSTILADDLDVISLIQRSKAVLNVEKRPSDGMPDARNNQGNKGQAGFDIVVNWDDGKQPETVRVTPETTGLQLRILLGKGTAKLSFAEHEIPDETTLEDLDIVTGDATIQARYDENADPEYDQLRKEAFAIGVAHKREVDDTAVRHWFNQLVDPRIFIFGFQNGHERPVRIRICFVDIENKHYLEKTVTMSTLLRHMDRLVGEQAPADPAADEKYWRDLGLWLDERFPDKCEMFHRLSDAFPFHWSTNMRRPPTSTNADGGSTCKACNIQ